MATTGPDCVDGAVLEALAYSDVFDWPLSLDEVHTYLPVRASRSDVAASLEGMRHSGRVEAAGAWWALPSRADLAEHRHACAERSARLWPAAVRVGRRVAALPWVRLVAVSGSLAVGAPEPGADIDLFVVTADGRLWLARALTIALARATARGEAGAVPVLCPNYLVSASALALPERDLFTARELAQLVPLAGITTYRALLDANGWYREFLPNHAESVGRAVVRRPPQVQRVAEAMLGHRAVDHVERWEMSRKIARLTSGGPGREVRFDATMCKGHFGGHGERVMAAFEARLARLQPVAP